MIRESQFGAGDWKDFKNEEEMIQFLLDNRYLTGIEKYADPKKVLQIPDEKFPEDILWNIEVLKKIISMPIMRDNIEEIPGEPVANEKREEIYDKLYKMNPALGVFYKDHNKLQASYLEQILHMISEDNIGQYVQFSESLKQEFEKLRLEFSGPEKGFSSARYKKELNNRQKIDLAERLTALAEDAILESVQS